MKLSVIIPTHNRTDRLRRTLEALAGQNLPQSEFEILVVDDGSAEACRRELRALSARFRFRLVEQEQGGLASARNHGAVEAGGELLLFLDDDVYPAPGSLGAHLAAHAAASGPVAVVGSLPYPPQIESNSFLSYLEHSGHYDLYKNPRKYPGGKPPMPPMNGNSSISRKLFHEIGRYDESFRQYGSEDLELGYRLQRAGIPFVYCPQAIGYHDHVKDFPAFCRDMETAGASLIQLYRKYPEIKAPKKIDIVEDPLSTLPGRKKLIKVVLVATLAFPALLVLPRLTIRLLGPLYGLRYLLFPCYRWVAHYHYALGMRRALAAR